MSFYIANCTLSIFYDWMRYFFVETCCSSSNAKCICNESIESNRFDSWAITLQELTYTFTKYWHCALYITSHICNLLHFRSEWVCDCLSEFSRHIGTAVGCNLPPVLILFAIIFFTQHIAICCTFHAFIAIKYFFWNSHFSFYYIFSPSTSETSDRN